MKIAICLSGQPRTWEKCYPQWMDIFKDQGEIDFFFHFWDYNTLPSILRTVNGHRELKDELLTENEQQHIIETLAPKKFLFEGRKPIVYWNSTLPDDKQFGGWTKEQFYSLYYVSHLKRSYEVEHNFQYDVVIRMRADLWFDHKHELISPAPNTVYTGHCGVDSTFNTYRVGDVFYYADSPTFDQMALFYKFLSLVPTNWVTSADECPPPEIALFFYMTNINVINHPTYTSLKVMRDSRVEAIQGYLSPYEISS